jgi:hypothetical protein
MDLSGISFAGAQSVSAAAASESANNKLFKQTLDNQKQTASQILESVPDPDSTLGQNIDVKA